MSYNGRHQSSSQLPPPMKGTSGTALRQSSSQSSYKHSYHILQRSFSQNRVPLHRRFSAISRCESPVPRTPLYGQIDDDIVAIDQYMPGEYERDLEPYSDIDSRFQELSGESKALIDRFKSEFYPSELDLSAVNTPDMSGAIQLCMDKWSVTNRKVSALLEHVEGLCIQISMTPIAHNEDTTDVGQLSERVQALQSLLLQKLAEINTVHQKACTLLEQQKAGLEVISSLPTASLDE